MAVPRLESGRTAVLMVDMQPRLLTVIHEQERVVAQTGKLLDGAKALDMPVLVTEQYPQGLGETIPELVERLPDGVVRHEKLKFSASIEPVREQLVREQVRSVIVAGIEGHICVLQTCLDLMAQGYVVAVAVDAISSRRAFDCQVGIQRMVQAGIVPTTVESALMEVVHEAGGPRFKAVLPVIK